MLTTVEEIVQDMMGHHLYPEDIQAMTTLTGIEAVWFKSSVLQFIRNTYRLWLDNPLTEKWRTDESSRDIRDGVDYSKDHPDNVSSVVYNRMKQIVSENLTK